MTGRRSRRWWWRGLSALGVYALLEVVLTLADFAPDALRLALLVALCVAAVGLVQDTLGDSGPTWPLAHPPPIVPPGSDERLAAYVRLIEHHLTARKPDNVLHDRLVRLSGGRVAGELAGRSRRLTPAEIDDYLRRIEEQ